jgi:hypothetical protein
MARLLLQMPSSRGRSTGLWLKAADVLLGAAAPCLLALPDPLQLGQARRQVWVQIQQAHRGKRGLRAGTRRQLLACTADARHQAVAAEGAAARHLRGCGIERARSACPASRCCCILACQGLPHLGKALAEDVCRGALRCQRVDVRPAGKRLLQEAWGCTERSTQGWWWWSESRFLICPPAGWQLVAAAWAGWARAPPLTCVQRAAMRELGPRQGRADAEADASSEFHDRVRARNGAGSAPHTAVSGPHAPARCPGASSWGGADGVDAFQIRFSGLGVGRRVERAPCCWAARAHAAADRVVESPRPSRNAFVLPRRMTLAKSCCARGVPRDA